MVWPRPLRWSQAEMDMLRSLWIGSLPPLPADSSNAVAGDPRAVALGHKLFFDTRFSASGQVSCATCHQPERTFVDGLPLAKGIGTMNRKTMTIIGTAYSPWLFWDGRKDSQWAQALGPLENPIEHGGTRTQYAHLIAGHYRTEYEALFGPLPDLSDRARFPATAGPVADPAARVAWEKMAPEDREAVTRIYANVGKAIAAYERQIIPGPSRFDTYAQALLAGETKTTQNTLTPDEVAGLRLFIGKAECTHCHNGPLFTNNAFHNTGVPAAAGLPEDSGRADGARQVLVDEFNCLSRYSDAEPEECTELRFVKTGEAALAGAFKPPTLRNVAESAPYMHAGQFATLRQVLAHYNRAAPGPVGKTELFPLGLSGKELAQLEAFLKTLSGPLTAPPALLAPPAN
ncbi:MAG: cytochrome-c peroxidase [Anaerolineae bacterium]|nr:cytochrome-c peroxidase [Anaerolineae bacterium]